MTIEASLYSKLSGYAGLAALVSTRIYPLVIPQEELSPAVTYQKISGVREGYTMGTDKGMPRSRWQITAWATTFDVARSVAAQILLALERWQDNSAGVQDTYIISEIDLYDPETLEYGTAIDVSIAEVFP